MISKFLKLFIVAILLAMPMAEAFAQVKGMIVTPKRIIFNENERLKELTLANRGTESQKYRISIVDRAMTEDGNLIEAKTPAAGEFFASDVIRFGPRQIDLDPKLTQKVRLMSRLPANAPDGEYRSHVLVQEIPKADPAASAEPSGDSTLGINVTAIYGISVPVFIRKGDLTADVTLSGGKVTKDEDSTYINIDINRTGTKSVFGTVKVFDGGTQIALLKGVAVYLSSPKRSVSVSVPNDIAQNLSGKTLRVTYSAVEPEEDAPTAETTFTVP